MGLFDAFGYNTAVSTGVGLFTSGAGSENMSFDGVTEGINRDAMKTYIDNLKLELLDNVEEAIDKVDDVLKTIDSGWQGVARDKFLNQFATQRSRIKDDLKKEYLDLLARLKELQDFYYKQDQNMLDLIDNADI